MIHFDSHPIDVDPKTIIAGMEHVRRHHDSQILLDIMQQISGEKAVAWGEQTIGFGQYHYIYKTGREGDWPIMAFTPSRENISIHIMQGLDQYKELLSRIGKFKRTETSLILHKFSDINLPALKTLLTTVYSDQKQN